MARPVLILFAKAPRLGCVKRRLAADIGDVAALRFYRNRLAATVRKLSAPRNFEKVVAITPDGTKLRLPPGWRLVGQGHGDLGARMGRAFARFRGRRVVLAGSDIPGLAAADFYAALRALGSKNTVFGPAMDGGYYLVAMGKLRPPKVFDGVRWSSPFALADTERNCRAVRRLRVLRDVDRAADLRDEG